MAKTRSNHGRGSIYQRKPDGLWVAQVHIGYNEKGRPKYKRVYRKENAAAVDALQELQFALRRGQPVDAKRLTVSEYLDQWMATSVEGSKEPKTIAYYRMMIDRHLKPTIGRIDLRKLTALHVQAMLTEKQTKADPKTKRILSASSVAGIRRTLRAALSRAWKLGLVAENVAQKTDPPKVKKADPVYLTPEQALALREKANGHPIENLLALTLGTGLRVGEATGLRWTDVDLDNGLLKITTQLQRISKKLTLKSLKSSSSRRTLPLIGLALEAVQAEQVRHAKLRAFLGDSFNELGLVFVNDGGRPFDPKYVDKHLKALCKAAEIPQVSFHKLRHTAATLMVAAGVPLALVKDQLGHSSITLTMGTYAHMLPTAQREAAEKLDQALRARSQAL